MPDSKRRARFERLFMPHLGAAYNFARWLVRHPHDAEDMVQEAYLKAYRSFDSFKGDAPLAWLLAILRNSCLTWLKRQQKQGIVIDFNDAIERNELKHMAAGHMEAPALPDAGLLAAAEQKRVREALSELAEPYRVVVILREFEDLKYAEIAEILGVPVGTVMSRLSRARGLLRTRLGDASDSVTDTVSNPVGDLTSDEGQKNEL